MIFLNAKEMIMAGLILTVLSVLIRPRVDHLENLPRKIGFALLRISRLAGIAALIAGVIVLVIPAFRPEDLTSENLKQLNERIDSYHALLEKSWIVSLLLLGSVFGCAWFGWIEATTARAKLAGRVVKATATLKVIVGFLTCFTFVASGIGGRVGDRLSETKVIQANLDSAQVEIYLQAKRVIEQNLIADIIHQSAAQNPSFRRVTLAYNAVPQYMPSRPVYDLPFASPRVPSAEDASKARRDTAETIPDISSSDTQRFKAELPNEGRGENSNEVLAEDMTRLVYDNTASDAFKKLILHINNPFISELVSAFLDPAFAEPAEEFVAREVAQVMNSHFDQTTVVSQVNQEATRLEPVILKRLGNQESSGILSDEMGDPRWAAVRNLMRDGAFNGWPGVTPEAQEEVRETVVRFETAWSNINIVIRSSDESEQAFAEYLKQAPDLAALWGYAVIDSSIGDPGNPGNDELNEIAINNPSPKTVEHLRSLVKMSLDGNKTAQEIMQKFDPNRQLNQRSQDIDYGRVWLQYDGVHPIHGYLLYQKETGQPVDEAKRYYQGDEVGKYVEKDCPRKQLSSNE